MTVWERHLFKKNFYGNFEFVPTFSKMVFSRASIKCFSLYGSNNSDFVVIENSAYGDIKDHSSKTKTFF